MKPHLILFLIFFLGFVVCLNAQEVEHNGKYYEVKGSSILLHGRDVTESLTSEDQLAIKHKYLAKEDEFREAKKQKKSVERDRKKAEKRQLKEERKAEKEVDGHKKFIIF